MKIAVVGKGGSGKTTTSAVVARTIARQGHVILALDCDTNPNLGISLGLGEEVTEELVALRDAVDSGDQDHAETPDELVRRFGVDAPEGVRLAVVSAIQNPQPGCPCCGISPEQLLGILLLRMLSSFADFEAGLGTVMRLDGRAAANRIRDEEDVTRLAAGRPPTSVPCYPPLPSPVDYDATSATHLPKGTLLSPTRRRASQGWSWRWSFFGLPVQWGSSLSLLSSSCLRPR